MVSKKDKFVTRKVLDEAVDAIITGVGNMFEEQNKALAGNFKSIDKRFTRIEAELSFIKNDIKDLKNDTPTRDEFERLKKQVQQIV